MKKIFNWEFASKLAVIFGIFGGIYLAYQVISYFFFDKLKFDTEISIVDFELPANKRKLSYWKETRSIIPESFNRYYLSREITDSVEKILNLSKYNKSIREPIEKSIPKEFDQSILADKIDSLIQIESYPIMNTHYFLYSSIKNISNKIVKELRFEIPSEGYYELYLNGDLIKKGDFKSNINIGELRPDNISILKIWAFNYIKKYQLSDKEIKYTFENGVIVPTLLDSIKAKGFVYWLYNNTLWSIYLLIFFPVYLVIVISSYLKNVKEASKIPNSK